MGIGRCFLGLLMFVLCVLGLGGVVFLIWWFLIRDETPPSKPEPQASAIKVPAPAPTKPEPVPEPEPVAVPEPIVAPEAAVAPDAAPPEAPDVQESVSFSATSDAPAEAPSDAEVPEETAPLDPDPLKRIEGIGPKVAGLLEQAGILTFAQLAKTDVERLRAILDDAGLRFMKPDSWPQQAALAADEDWDGLAKLQDELKGGRRA